MVSEARSDEDGGGLVEMVKGTTLVETAKNGVAQGGEFWHPVTPVLLLPVLIGRLEERALVLLYLLRASLERFIAVGHARAYGLQP